MLRADRAGGGLRPARHEDPRATRWRRLRHQRHQALHLSHADDADFVVALRRHWRGRHAARATRKRITAFLVDTRHARLRPSATATHASLSRLQQLAAELRRCAACRAQVLGEGHRGLRSRQPVARCDASAWARTCLRPGGARARPGDPQWAASRKQFGQAIGKFQGVVVQARRHGNGTQRRRTAHAGGRLEGRPGHADRRRHVDGKV